MNFSSVSIAIYQDLYESKNDSSYTPPPPPPIGDDVNFMSGDGLAFMNGEQVDYMETE